VLRSNLVAVGIGDRYREPEHGKLYIYPEGK